MKPDNTYEAPISVSGLQVDRRGFLTGISVVLGSLPLQTLNAAPKAAAQNAIKGEARRALFQQMPYYSFERALGPAESYTPAPGSAATRDYVASISHEEFLRRHWFS